MQVLLTSIKFSEAAIFSTKGRFKKVFFSCGAAFFGELPFKEDYFFTKKFFRQGTISKLNLLSTAVFFIDQSAIEFYTC